MQAESRIRYMVHPSIQNIVQDGISAASNIHVTDCGIIEYPSRMYLFCLWERGMPLNLTVRHDHNVPICPCDHRGPICKHVFWLIDQILLCAAELGSNFPKQIRLKEDGTASIINPGTDQDISYAGEIETIGINIIGLLRKWNVHLLSSPDTGGRDQTAGGTNHGDLSFEERVDLLLWILEPSDAIWEEFSKCCARPFAGGSEGKEVLRKVWGQFGELVKSLLQNESIKETLNAMLTHDFSTAARLVQLKTEYQRAFRKVDALQSLLHPKSSRSVTEPADMIRGCAKEIVSLYDKGSNENRGNVWYAAGLLINILHEVVNSDQKGRGNYQKSAQDDNPSKNLYVRLISDTEGGLLFVLETLDTIHPTTLLSYEQSLRRISLDLRPVSGNQTFINRFQHLVARCSAEE